MKSLPLPHRNDQADFRTCVENRRHTEASILAQLERTIQDAYSRYEEIAFSDVILDSLPHEYCQILRTNTRLLDPGRPLHGMRQQIMALGDTDRCPYCERSPVSSLDHHLPKSSHPHYSVLARNLVPICDRCNRNKSNLLKTDLRQRFFHPYYDDISEYRLVAAVVSISDFVDISFFIDQSCGASPDIIDMVEFTFARLGLAQFFVQEAYDEISDHVFAFQNQHLLGGREAVASILNESHSSFRAKRGANYWKSVLYDALANSEDFCDGGFAYLLPMVVDD